jgi:hypothetical protein
MRLVVALLALAAAPVHAEDAIAPDWAADAGRPAFQTVQAVADGVFGLASGDVLRPLLPDRLSDQLRAAPEGDSYDAFAARLREREERAARQDLDTRPAAGAAPEDFQAWSRDALAAHRDAAYDAFAAAMAERYGLPGFGRSANDYALDPDRWTADAVAPGVLLGGAYAYLAGVRADLLAGPVKLGVDLAPGDRLRAAAESGSGGRLARVSVSSPGSPLSLYTEWSARSSERVGASWSKRF